MIMYEATPDSLVIGKDGFVKVWKESGKKFITGDYIIDGKFNVYLVIYKDNKPKLPVFAGEKWDGSYPEGTVPCIKIRKYQFKPDRRFMSVRTTKNVIGQFKVWFLKEDEVQLYRRIVSEKTPDFIGPNNIVRDISNEIFKFNSEKYPLIATSILISYATFDELCGYFTNHGGPLVMSHNMGDIRFRELTVYRSEDVKKERFIILSDGKR